MNSYSSSSQSSRSHSFLSSLLLISLLLIGSHVSCNITTRTQHQLYFKQSRFSTVINPENKPFTVLNTFMGSQIYDRNQNIGLILASGQDSDLCSSKDMSEEKLHYLKNSLALQMYLYIKVSTRCAFGAQVREAVLIGAKGVILYDPVGDRIPNPVPAINMDSISIPVLIVEKLDKGKQLFDLLKAQDFDGQYALCHISFQPAKKLQFPTVTYFSSSIHKESLPFFENIYEFIKQYDPTSNLTVQAIPRIYQSLELTKICTNADLHCIESTESQILSQDCYSDGKYCAIHNSKYLKALDIIDHEIFQYELSILNSKEWARYMISFIPECYEVAERGELKITLTECGSNLLKSYNAPLLSMLLKAVNESWLDGTDQIEIDKSIMTNNGLDFARIKTQEYGITQWPSLILNGAVVEDQKLYLRDHLSKTLCNSFLYPSRSCQRLLQYGSSIQVDDDLGDDVDANPKRAGKVIKPAAKASVPKGWVITLSLLSGFLIGGIIFWFLRRNHIRSMNSMLHQKVKQAVSKYNQFNDANAQFQELV